MGQLESILMANRYTFEREPHGSGGFAKVIKGRDNILERDIAIKVLDPLVTEFPEVDQERFRREARILARLSHPNIPAIYDVHFGPREFLIAFQFIEGRTLGQIVTEEGPCGISEVKSWFHQIASALDHAHSLAIVHRDVKPPNIIVRPDRESAYLVDFGIALSAEDARKITKSGLVLGTAGYMSPEQMAGENLDARADIYSLGVTLYEGLAGKPLPHGKYEALSSGNEAIPSQIDDLILDCVCPKDRRIRSAKEFAARLSGALKTTRPLSDVLAHGRLHELASVIEELTASTFMSLPEGQRALILAKVSDITSSGDPQLYYASEKFLGLMLTRGIMLDKEDYREIVIPAIRWGFEMEFEGGFTGRPSVRRALEEAAYLARGENHRVLQEEFGKYLNGEGLDKKGEWFLHAAREILEALLANPACTAGSSDLVAAYKKLNQLQRAARRATA